jgi:DNA-binding CsgD family transcriptional regulator
MTETEVAMQSWTAYLELGSMKAAAARLGIHEITVRKRIAALRDMYGVKTNVQLAVALERRRVA